MTTREDIARALDAATPATVSPFIEQRYRWLRWQQERIAELEAALRWYSDERNYDVGADTTYGNGPGGQQMQPPSIDRDRGRRALAALRTRP